MIRNKFYKMNKYNKRICLFADVHYNFDYDLTRFDKIIKNIKNNKPDYICIPGDIVDSSDIISDIKIDYLTKFIKDLSLICPVILVKGNHDETRYINKKHCEFDTDKYYNKLNKIDNVYYLDNNHITLDNINFYGIRFPYDYYNSSLHEDNDAFIEKLDSIKVNTENNILLCHGPRNVLSKKTIETSKNINKFYLVLSGHMHNGLVFNFLDWKGNRGFIGPYKDLFPDYARGMKKKNNTTLVVTGGIITFSLHAPKLLYKINNIYPMNIDYIDI